MRTNLFLKKSNIACLKSAFFGLAIIFCSGNLSAQIFPNLVSEQEAIARLEAQIPFIEDQVSGFAPNSPQAILGERRITLHIQSYEDIKVGETVEGALKRMLVEVAIDDEGQLITLDEFVESQDIDLGEPNASYDYIDPAFNELINLLRAI